VVLRLLQARDALADVSHLIIDEVHERDVNTDFLLAAVKLLLPQRPRLKIVLMCAPVETFPIL
jgi:HrpA-like RNA helicase